MQRLIKDEKKFFFSKKLEQNIGEPIKSYQRLLHQIFAKKKMTVCFSVLFPFLTTLKIFFQILRNREIANWNRQV